MPPPSGAGACWYWPATPGTKCPGGIRRSCGGCRRASPNSRAPGAAPRPAGAKTRARRRGSRSGASRWPRRSPETAPPPSFPAPAHGRRGRPSGHARGQAFVQPVHDQHDRTPSLVVEPAVEGVVVPFVGRPPARVAERLLGFSGSSMTIRSAPRPVRTPPTPAAMRPPRAVVSNSAIAWRVGASRVGNSQRYQGLRTMRRQSRDHLSASSWPPGYACDGLSVS